MKVVTTRIPNELFNDLRFVEEEEKADRAEVLRRLLADALKRWKIKKAVELLREKKATLRKAAAIAGVHYWEMLEIAALHGIEIGYTLKDLESDLERI